MANYSPPPVFGRYGADPAAAEPARAPAPSDDSPPSVPKSHPEQAADDVRSWTESMFDEIDVDVSVEKPKRGKVSATVSITAPNPLEVLEAVASRVLEAAGRHDVQVSISGLDQPAEVQVTFSTK